MPDHSAERTSTPQHSARNFPRRLVRDALAGARESSPTLTPEPAQEPRSGLSVLVVYALLASLIMIGTWALIAQDWLREQQLQEAELLSQVRAAEAHLAHSLREADDLLHLLAWLRPHLADHPGRAADSPALRLESVMATELARSARVSAVYVRDARGRTVARAAQRGRARQLEPLTEPPRAEELLPPATRLHAPQQSPDGRWHLPLEQVLRNPQGEIAGSLLAMIDSSSLREYLHEIRLNPDDGMLLLDLQGRPLLAFGKTSEYSLPEFAGGRAWQPDAATVQSLRRELDGEMHIIALLRVQGYPLILAASRPADLTRQGFLQMRQRLIAGASSLILLLGVLSWLLHFDLRRQRQAHAAVARLNATLEARVRERTAELEQSNAELVAFSYSISHDLRAPLRAINGFAHALREDCSAALPAQGLDYVDRIYRASVRMGELIDELLKLASISRHSLNTTELDLGIMAHEIMEELKLAEPLRPLEFALQGTLLAEGDGVLMRNALANLLGNAWKFTRMQALTRITVSGEEEAEYMRITVADNGIGFDMDHARKLFQPFQQLHAHQGFGGSGIGLASVRRIIERHGGQIWAEATPGEGARFIMRLPRRARVIRRRAPH